MKVLVACECSGVVREAFTKRGHDAWSCDLLPSDIPSKKHIQGDALKVLNDGWDLLIAHPPCTHLATSGRSHFKYKQKEQKEALEFFLEFLNAPIHMICVENPVAVVSSRIRKPDQIIQPFYFDHPLMKSTCLWLKNLPRLKPTNIVEPEWVTTRTGRKWSKWFHSTGCLPLEIRAKVRSTTFQGIADAMADQWNKITTIGFDIPEFHIYKIVGGKS